ncbi:predicted protein [Uncinocarpus reesii 1704]|uniref:CFEM domain-containing protein n=1 Tax=Uncinocarpus reesii (strain UAMH 1704) TaxID=336963 RepID=C4JXR9_UNCRE|nr:uncharacterized protein UREG_07857 [Uncinocarpus reesii 1704]EEP82992.1 predicted protein [Uncinocarpus reesii 1704]
MKFSTVAVALTSLVAAATALDPIKDLPPCAQECATNSIPKHCGIEVKCICTAASFLEAITCCVAQKCSPADQQATIKFANGICGTEGITNLPQSAICTTNSATSSVVSRPTGNITSSATTRSTPSGTPTISTSPSGNTAATKSSAPGSATSKAAAASLSNANGGAIAAIAGLLMVLA